MMAGGQTEVRHTAIIDYHTATNDQLYSNKVLVFASARCHLQVFVGAVLIPWDACGRPRKISFSLSTQNGKFD